MIITFSLIMFALLNMSNYLNFIIFSWIYFMQIQYEEGQIWKIFPLGYLELRHISSINDNLWLWPSEKGFVKKKFWWTIFFYEELEINQHIYLIVYFLKNLLDLLNYSKVKKVFFMIDLKISIIMCILIC